jgi:hypothetical protein
MGSDFQDGLNYVFYGMYGENYADVRLKATCLDRTGNYMWEGNHIFVSNVEQEVIHPILSTYFNFQWVVGFTSTRNGNYDIYAQNVNQDGTLGVNTIGIPDLATADFKLFPNPASKVLTITTEDSGNIEILDLTGKVVIEQKTTGKETNIDLSELNPGIYFVRVINGQSLGIKKILHL